MRKQSGNNYRKVLDHINSLRININSSYRGDCPSCGGANTFCATNKGNNLTWYCFRASCQIKGNTKKEITLFAAKDFLDTKPETEPTAKPLKDFIGWESQLPVHALEYLAKNNCMDAYKLEPHRFYFDKVQNRLVFVTFDVYQNVTLATGRSLNGDTPKWYKYFVLPGEYYGVPKFIGNTSRIFICEDCASACSLSRFDYALALCGTTYRIIYLLKYVLLAQDEVVICLDKDAQAIALELQKNLQPFCECRVVIKNLSNDAKYLNEHQLEKELNN